MDKKDVYICMEWNICTIHICGIFLEWNITETFKKNEILPFATMCVDLQGIVLSEVSQTDKDKYSYMESKK